MAQPDSPITAHLDTAPTQLTTELDKQTVLLMVPDTQHTEYKVSHWHRVLFVQQDGVRVLANQPYAMLLPSMPCSICGLGKLMMYKSRSDSHVVCR